MSIQIAVRVFAFEVDVGAIRIQTAVPVVFVVATIPVKRHQVKAAWKTVIVLEMNVLRGSADRLLIDSGNLCLKNDAHDEMDGPLFCAYSHLVVGMR
jgi:hypothetical protein